MPQTRKKPSAVELYEREQSRRQPRGPRLSAVESYEQEQRYRRLQPSPEPPGYWESVKIAAERGYRKYIDPMLAATGEVVEGLTVGDPRPALRIGESAIRGTVEALRIPQQATPVRDPQTGTIMELRAQPPRDTRITELAQQRQARYQATPEYQYNQQRLAELNARAALDPSITGKAVRGTVEFLTGAAPTLGVAIATRGAVAPTAIAAAVQSANQPEMMGPNVASGLLPIPAGKFVAPILRRIRGGRGAVAEAAETAVAREAATAAREVPPAVGETAPLQSAMQKLGTNDADEVGAMIANANRRYNNTITVPGGKKRPITAAERESYWEDFNRLKALSPAEHRALSQVLPPRTYSPIGIFDEGISSRNIADIPASQPNAQLDANLRELEQFFGAQKAASPALANAIGKDAFDTAKVKVADLGLEHTTPPARPAGARAVERTVPVDDITLGRDDLSKGRMFQVDEMLEGGVKPERKGVPLSEQVEPITVVPDPNRPGKFIVEDDGNHRVALLKLRGRTEPIPVKSYETPAQSAAMRGPRAETAALEVGPATAPGTPAGTPPPEFTGGGFSRPPGQQNLFSGRIATPAERTPLIQTISSLFKAGMLTRPTTHLKNLGGNLGFQISEEVARIPGAIVDMVISPFTKRRTLTGPSLGSVARSSYNAATKGVDDAIRVLKTGKTPIEIQGLEEIASGSKVVDAYVNGVFRLLKAEDALFKAYAFKRAFEDRVRAAVLTEMRQGVTPRGQYGARVRELTKFPPSDIANGAILDAEIATFNNPNITGAIRTGVTKTLQRFGDKYGQRIPGAKQAAQTAEFAIDRIIPFAKTPANVIGKMLDYTPLGAAKVSTKAIARRLVGKSMTAEQQRAFSQTFGRSAVGSGLLALGYIGYRDGWLTGLNEDDTSKRARDTATGRIPGAILVNGEWHQITGVSPIGNVVAIGATLAREAEQEQVKAKEEGKQAGLLKKAGTAAKVAGQAALEQPLLAGTKQFIEGIEQPGSAGARYLGSIAGQVIPGGISDVGQLIDPTQREAQTLAARVMERIPGVRQMLPERLDVLGQPQEAPFPLNPARSQAAKQASNPYFAELVRHDIGISGFQKKPDETDEQLRQRKTEFGKIVIPYGVKLASSPQYQRATPEIQQEALKTLNSRAKDLVEKGKQRFAAGPLSPQALIGSATASTKREAAKKKRGQK